jgi:hypothetical protein
MRNSPRLPYGSLLVAMGLVVLLAAVTAEGGRIPLTEIELGLVAGALAFTVFGVQGLISVLLEGEELQPGRRGSWLTGPLTVAIVLFSLTLFAVAVALGWGIAADWSTRTLGLLAGAGSLVLALLLVLYKEAFIGEEATFDDLEDGVPW